MLEDVFICDPPEDPAALLLRPRPGTIAAIHKPRGDSMVAPSGPKYMPYTYMDPFGEVYLDVRR